MKTTDRILAWLLALLSCGHAYATTLVYKTFSADALWFFSFSIVVWLTAALNLLRIRYAAVAPGVRITSIVVNVVLLVLLVLIADRLGLRQNPQVGVFIAVVALGTGFSLRPVN